MQEYQLQQASNQVKPYAHSTLDLQNIPIFEYNSKQ